MSETKVVNLRKEKCDVKVTRTPGNQVPEPPNAGCFGNPYSVQQFGRERCLELYSEYFHKKLQRDERFRQAVLALKGKTLGCFCKPDEGFNGKLHCHAQIIAAWLDDKLPQDIP